MNPNDLDFLTDTTGVSYKLREAGVRACQSICDAEQHKCIKQTLKVLFQYADACFQEREAEKAIVLERIKCMHMAASKYQHEAKHADTGADASAEHGAEQGAEQDA